MDHTPNRSAWLKGPAFPCDPPPARVHPLRLALLGAPGVGKGTQAELLARARGACHLSTGDMLRAARSADPVSRTAALADALSCMRHGQLVPDGTVVDRVRERAGCLRCHAGFLLDGFPRTIGQADALDRLLQQEGIPLDAVLAFDLPIERLVRRVAGRLTCAGCHLVYHVDARPPARPGFCDRCAGALVQRDDDRPEATRMRMRQYAESTTPLLEYYRGKGLLLEVSAEGTPQEVCARASAALDARRGTGTGAAAAVPAAPQSDD
jgi:adenylate kinase